MRTKKKNDWFGEMVRRKVFPFDVGTVVGRAAAKYWRVEWRTGKVTTDPQRLLEIIGEDEWNEACRQAEAKGVSK